MSKKIREELPEVQGYYDRMMGKPIAENPYPNEDDTLDYTSPGHKYEQGWYRANYEHLEAFPEGVIHDEF